MAEQLSSGVQTVVGTATAFAAMKVDGSVVTWDSAFHGGDSRGVAEQLSTGVQTVVGNSRAFAAVKVDGSVVTWGEAEFGGDSRGVAEQLSSGSPEDRGASPEERGPFLDDYEFPERRQTCFLFSVCERITGMRRN